MSPSHQPLSSRLPCSICQACSACAAGSASSSSVWACRRYAAYSTSAATASPAAHASLGWRRGQSGHRGSRSANRDAGGTPGSTAAPGSTVVRSPPSVSPTSAMGLEPDWYVEPGEQVVVVDPDCVFLELVGAGGRAELGGYHARLDGRLVHERPGDRDDEVGLGHGRVVPRVVGLVRIGGGAVIYQWCDPDPVAAVERGDVRFPVSREAVGEVVGFEPVGEVLVPGGLDRLEVVVGQPAEVADEPEGEHRLEPGFGQPGVD